jgi:hypothetical protein
MKNESLGHFIAKLEGDCKESNIQVFYGSFIENDLLPAHIVDDQRKNWQHYLRIIKSLDIPLITVSTVVNDLDDAEFYQEKIDELAEDERNPYSAALAKLAQHRGEVMQLQVHFFHQSVCYQFCLDASWYFDYQFLDKLYDFEDNDDEDDDFEPPAAVITGEQIESIARSVIEKPAYLKARNNVERIRVLWNAKEMLDVPHRQRESVHQKAEEIFQAEIFPKQEQALRAKILEMKKDGYKKGQIKAKLDITDNMLNRHYYDA